MDFAESIPIFDGHNDTLLRLYQSDSTDVDSFFSGGGPGHLDLPRAVKGQFGGGFFAMFVPSKKDQLNPPRSEKEGRTNRSDWDASGQIPIDYARKTVGEMLKLLKKLDKKAKGNLRIVVTKAELDTCLKNRTVAAVIHLEGAEAIEPDLSNLAEYYDAGLRSIGITWSRENAFGHGVPFKYPSSPDTGPGLTEVGRKLVKTCNQKGIILDLSHLNEKGFWEVASLSDKPLVVTHSNVHALCPASRNLTDKQLEVIAESNGIVGINFHVGFLRADGKNNPDTPISDIVHHIDYVVNKIGIDHVAFGSDFDGATMPNSIKDVAGFPKLIVALENRGYGIEALKKIAYQNWQRVINETWLS